MSAAWDNARRHARALETAVDAKLASYSKVASMITRGDASAASPNQDEDGAGGYKLIEEQIDELLGKVWHLSGHHSL
jgi:Golgi SNAP receptor complex protein 1